VVFTLPRQLAPLALQNKKVVYDLLFRTSAETLFEVARDPQHLGAQIGFFSVLHTWSQKIELHPHVHCVVPAGGLSADRSRWIKPAYAFFLPVKVLSRVFRGKFVAALQHAFQDGSLSFHGDLQSLTQPKIFAAWLRPLFRKDWVVYAKPPFGGPEHVLRYLGRYTHRVAISNHRLISFADGKVTFRWRDSAQNNEQKLMTLSLDEFLRRFLCTCSRKVSCASATSASWPTANVPPPCHFPSNCSAGHRKPSNRLPPPVPAIFGLAPSVVDR
jgi:hypothetical protein